MAKTQKKPKRGAKPDPELKKILPKIKSLYKTKSFSQVAKELNISTHTVRNACTKYKFKKATWHWDKPEEDLLLKLWDTHSVFEIQKEIALKFNIERSRWSIIGKYRELKGLRKK